MRNGQFAIEKRNYPRRRLPRFVIGEVEMRNSRMRFSIGELFEQRVVVGKKPNAQFRTRIENRFRQIEGKSGVAEVIDGGNEEVDVGRRIGHGGEAFTFHRSRVYLAMSICKNPSLFRTMAKPLPSAFLDRLSAFLSEPDFRSVLSGFSAERPASFRVNGLKSKTDEVEAELTKKGIRFEAFLPVPGAYVVPRENEYALK